MKKILNNLLLILIIIFIVKVVADTGSEKVKKSDTEDTNIQDTKFQYDEKNYISYSEEAQQYFKEIALGREFEPNSKLLTRWTKDMKIYVYGEHGVDLDEELQKIVFELNEIIIPIEIEIVSDPQVSNMSIYFCSYQQLHKIKPHLKLDILESNWGYFSSGYNGGLMYVDITRANELEQRHLLREELTQSLGLFDDSYKYEESIFYQGWTTTTEYAPIDRELIDMLYNN